MVYCAEFGCNEGSAKGGNTSFFGFPKDATLRDRWVANMRRDCFTPAKHSRLWLCSLHFERSCFDRDPVLMASLGYKGARISLKSDAVPTLFPVVERTPSIRLSKASRTTVSVSTTSTCTGADSSTDEITRPAYRKQRRGEPEVCQIYFTLILLL